MSSAHDEADDGPTHEESEEERQRIVDAKSTDYSLSHDRKYLSTRPNETDPDNDEVEKEEGDSLTGGAHAPLNNGIYLGGDRPPVTRDTTPEIGRPSSADGSLSIPDDTPSIQVST